VSLSASEAASYDETLIEENSYMRRTIASRRGPKPYRRVRIR
jgi:hypothetical protein